MSKPPPVKLPMPDERRKFLIDLLEKHGEIEHTSELGLMTITLSVGELEDLIRDHNVAQRDTWPPDIAGREAFVCSILTKAGIAYEITTAQPIGQGNTIRLPAMKTATLYALQAARPQAARPQAEVIEPRILAAYRKLIGTKRPMGTLVNAKGQTPYSRVDTEALDELTKAVCAVLAANGMLDDV